MTVHQPVTDERSDEQLLAEHRLGDKSTFQILVQRYQRELFHFLMRFVGDRQLADDVFQETFLQVHQSAATFDATRRFRPWLFAIAANKGRDMIRQTNRKVFSALAATIEPTETSNNDFAELMNSKVLTPDATLEKAELRKKVQQTVMDMPEHLREVLLLSYFHQFQQKQISEMLDIPLGTVKSRVYAAIAFFADKWREIEMNPKGH